jgi:hypothetical protein
MRILLARYRFPKLVRLPVALVGLQNPDVTRVRVFVPGHRMIEKEIVLDGLSPPPDVIRVQAVARESERRILGKALRALQPCAQDTESDRAARHRLGAYLLERNQELAFVTHPTPLAFLKDAARKARGP